MSKYVMTSLGLDATSTARWNLSRDGAEVLTNVPYRDGYDHFLAHGRPGDSYSEVSVHGRITCDQTYEEFMEAHKRMEDFFRQP